MPSLQEIYNDAVQTVEKEPDKIRSNFWVAITAYKMMQDQNYDANKDYDYAEISLRALELQNDPVFPKAIKVYGNEQTLERMKNPADFLKVYNAFANNKDLVAYDELKANEKAAYEKNVSDIRKTLEDTEKQIKETYDKITSIVGETPEKIQLRERSKELAGQRKDQQKSISDARVEQAKRSIALAIANEKNGGLGAVSPGELENSLAELKNDLYFESKLAKMNQRDLNAAIDDPSKFIEEYRAEKTLFDELEDYKKNKDYVKIVDRIEELFGNDNDPMHENYQNAVNLCFEQSIPFKGADQELDDDTKDFIIGVSDELSRRISQNSMAVRQEEVEMRGRVRNGEFPETRLINDNTKLLDKIAKDLTLYQTDAARKMEIYSQMNEMFVRCTTTSDSTNKGTIDGKTGRNYILDKLFNTIKDTYEKNHPEFLEGMDKHPDGPSEFIKEQYFYQPRKDRDGFIYKNTRAKEGESYFEGMPAFHKKLLDMTPEEFLKFENDELRKRAIDAEAPEKFKGISKKADYLIEELDEESDEIKETEIYKKVYNELKNFQNLGTKDFITVGNVGDKRTAKSGDLSRPTVKMALSRLDEVAEEYMKYDPDFARKIKGFIWERNIEYKKYLENDPLPENDFKLVEKAKNVREDIRTAKFNEYADITKRQADFGGENGKIKKLTDKYNKAKVIFGKKEFDIVGEMLGRVAKSFETMEKNEKLRDSKNKQEDANANNALLKDIRKVIEDLELLKEATGKYFEHKKNDGQWIGNNKNANKRIAAVKDIDEFADTFIEIMKTKSDVLDKMIKGKLTEQQALNAQVKQPEPPKQPSPEEKFTQSKQSFANEAAEVWLKNKFKSYIDEQINKKHPDYTEQQRQQVHEQNADKVGEYIAQNKDALKNDEAFKRFMEGIKNKHDLEDMKQYALADNGSKLYRIINGERVIEKEPADLDKRIKRAQENLTDNKSTLAENEFPNPGHDSNYNEYATIVTAYYVKAHKQELGENITNETFDSLKNEIKSKMVMKNVIKLNKPETLYSKATADKGQNIWSEYSNKLTKYNEQKKIIEDNKKTATINKELNNGEQILRTATIK